MPLLHFPPLSTYYFSTLREKKDLNNRSSFTTYAVSYQHSMLI